MSQTLASLKRSVIAGATIAAVCLAAPAVSLAAARFVCHAQPTQTCYFTVLRESGARTAFTLAHGEVKAVEDAAPGRDRYMVTINTAPPVNPAACSRTPSGTRRSTWCKLATIGEHQND